MSTVSLTSQQQRVLFALQSYRDQHGICPSFREVQQSVGLASPSAVQWHLRNLRDCGLVTWRPSLPRTLCLTEAGLAYLATNHETDSSHP